MIVNVERANFARSADFIGILMTIQTILDFLILALK